MVLISIKYPINQIVWMHYFEHNDLKYVLTSDISRATYNLYKLSKDKLIKLKTSKSPLFTEIYPEKIGGDY